MEKTKVGRKQMKTLDLLNQEWTVEMKGCFLEKFMNSRYSTDLIDGLVNEVGGAESLGDGIKAKELFKMAIESIEEKYDDLLLRMYLCRYSSTYNTDDVDAVAIIDLSRMLMDVLEETGYYERFEYPKNNFLSKSNHKPVTSILISMLLHENDCKCEECCPPMKDFDIDFVFDLPTLLFATSYRNIYISSIETYYQKELAAKKELAKVNAVVDKQKEDILKLKKAKSEVSKQVKEEYDTKLQKEKVENQKLKAQIAELEKDIINLQSDITKVSQERDSYKISLKKEVEKNENYEVIKANLIKEKEEVQSIKREYAELLKTRQYEYTERDWVSGIFSIFMSNKEEMVKLYRDSLMIINDELNKHFNKTQNLISFKQNNLENEKTPIAAIGSQNVRTTKRKIGYLELVNNEWRVGNVKINLNGHQQVLMENVFVLVDENNNFLSQLNAELLPERPPYNVSGTKNTFYCFLRNGKYVDADGVEVRPVFTYLNWNVRENQVLALNDKNEVLSVLPKIRLNADKVMPFVKMNDFEIVVVKNIINDFIIAKDVVTQEDKMVKFDNLDDYQTRIDLDSTIIYKDNHIYTAFRSPLFYKMSEFFTDKEVAVVVEVVNDDYFVEKTNGEIVKIQKNYNQYRLSVDDVVLIDKDNNFLYKESYAEVKNSEEKTLNFRKKVKEFKEKVVTPVTESLLIIGNPNYKHSYELGMKRNGVKAEVVDGYSSYYSIKKKSSEYDKIVVISSFISHENMFKIKEEFTSKKVVYPEKDGVNFIYETVFGAKTN